jgi:hypothetical protein
MSYYTEESVDIALRSAILTIRQPKLRSYGKNAASKIFELIVSDKSVLSKFCNVTFAKAFFRSLKPLMSLKDVGDLEFLRDVIWSIVDDSRVYRVVKDFEPDSSIRKGYDDVENTYDCDGVSYDADDTREMCNGDMLCNVCHSRILAINVAQLNSVVDRFL